MDKWAGDFMRKNNKTVLILCTIVFISAGCSNGVQSENIPVETPCVSAPEPTTNQGNGIL